MRGCACGDRDGVSSPELGVAHVSCLAEQAKILYNEAVENNLSEKLRGRWDRWHTCGLCEQHYHGVVSHALGWACWKTYLGRSEGDVDRIDAMNILGNGLSEAKRDEEALSVWEAELSTLQRFGRDERDSRVMIAQHNMAQCYERLGQIEKCFAIEQRVYRMQRDSLGDGHDNTRISASNLARTLAEGLNRHKEAAKFLRKEMPTLTRNIGRNHVHAIKLRLYLANCLCAVDDAPRADLQEAVAILEDINPRTRRVFGPAHPEAQAVERALAIARGKLAEFDARA